MTKPVESLAPHWSMLTIFGGSRNINKNTKLFAYFYTRLPIASWCVVPSSKDWGKEDLFSDSLPKQFIFIAARRDFDAISMAMPLGKRQMHPFVIWTTSWQQVQCHLSLLSRGKMPGQQISRWQWLFKIYTNKKGAGSQAPLSSNYETFFFA